jgi:hypothetical protein
MNCSGTEFLSITGNALLYAFSFRVHCAIALTVFQDVMGSTLSDAGVRLMLSTIE